MSAPMPPRAAELIQSLGLTAHPEGGWYRELYRSPLTVTPPDGRGERAALTTIYFLLTDAAHSRWHQVDSDEVWHLYEGGPLEVLQMPADCGGLSRHRLTRPGEGGAPVHTVAAGYWQAARSLGPYVLVGCTVAPGFDFADFRLLADDPARATRVSGWRPEAALLL